ncbi:hypothetical protein AGR7A_pAt30162 [Agrobacterium deltaense NCPPB 1641]|uniref:Uncharacterized protein n=1 Tax=Agrobacterium deltaense NCPPB 1641 TaxID=1183425 RepID=A0A1S7UB78_9HYPH|nr:hypothetical protein AGR7A_pAt30162 [Agrobacterium deltaense NCPPB 1641]
MATRSSVLLVLSFTDDLAPELDFRLYAIDDLLWCPLSGVECCHKSTFLTASLYHKRQWTKPAECATTGAG